MNLKLALALLLSAPALASEATTAIAQRILFLSNEARQQAGLRPLTLDDRLSQAAQQHSQEMDALHYFAHSSPRAEFATPGKRMNAFGFYSLSSGENLHREQGATPAQVADQAVRDWLNSPQHRKNLLNAKYNRMGLGVTCAGNQITITQDLAYTAIEVLSKQVKATPGGYHLSLSCRVHDGPASGALLLKGKRCANWTADQQGYFELEVDLPSSGTVSLGQADGERSWLIETEFEV